MRSKVIFDLDDHNSSVIRATVIYTEDIRDKIAKRFVEGFASRSRLAFVSFTSTSEGVQLEITPIHPRHFPLSPYFYDDVSINDAPDSLGKS